MKIAVDYDKTFTTNKGFWLEFMIRAQELGWEVFIATQRHPELDWNEDFDQLEAWHDIKTYFTDGKAKKQALEELGIYVDIWVDDMPEKILHDSTWGPDSPELAAWRANGRK